MKCRISVYPVTRTPTYCVLPEMVFSNTINLFGVMFFSVLFGWQQFSSTNHSTRAFGIGNLMAMYRGHTHLYTSWNHKTMFVYHGVKEFLENHGFRDVKIKGAGHYPFHAKFV